MKSGAIGSRHLPLLLLLALLATRHPRWKRPYTDLAYQPMLEVLRYLRANSYKTFIVTGGGQDFVRVYAEHGIPPEQVVGTAGGTLRAWLTPKSEPSRSRCMTKPARRTGS
jgi:hypothetical protein